MNLSDVRQALADRLATIPETNVYPTVPDSIDVPAFVVLPASSTPIDFDGGESVIMSVLVLVSRADAPSGQDQLDAYLSSTGVKSIRVALEADPDLGSEVDSSRYAGFENYAATFEFNAVQYIGAQVNVELMDG